MPSNPPRETRRGLLAAGAASAVALAGCQSSLRSSGPVEPESLRVEVHNQNGGRTTVQVVVADYSGPVFEDVVTLRTSDDLALATDLTGTSYDVEVAEKRPDADAWQRRAEKRWRWRGCRNDGIVVEVFPDRFRVGTACSGH